MQSTLFTITGFACLVLALVFGLFNQVRVGSIANGLDDAWAPNVTNAGASAGFAIAGGLCFIAAAICVLASSRSLTSER